MDILQAVKRKLSNLAGGVVSSVKSSIPKVSNFLQKYPSPASYVSSIPAVNKNISRLRNIDLPSTAAGGAAKDYLETRNLPVYSPQRIIAQSFPAVGAVKNIISQKPTFFSEQVRKAIPGKIGTGLGLAGEIALPGLGGELSAAKGFTGIAKTALKSIPVGAAYGLSQAQDIQDIPESIARGALFAGTLGGLSKGFTNKVNLADSIKDIKFKHPNGRVETIKGLTRNDAVRVMNELKQLGAKVLDIKSYDAPKVMGIKGKDVTKGRSVGEIPKGGEIKRGYKQFSEPIAKAEQLRKEFPNADIQVFGSTANLKRAPLAERQARHFLGTTKAKPDLDIVVNDPNLAKTITSEKSQVGKTDLRTEYIDFYKKVKSGEWSYDEWSNFNDKLFGYSADDVVFKVGNDYYKPTESGLQYFPANSDFAKNLLKAKPIDEVIEQFNKIIGSGEIGKGVTTATPSLPIALKTASIEESATLLPFQKDLDRFTALVKQNEKYQTGIPAIGKLKSSQQIADELGIPHEQFMDQVLGRAGKTVARLPASPLEALQPKPIIPIGKERGVLRTVRTAGVTTPELQKGIETIPPETRYYTPYSDKKSLTDAQSLIATEGIDAVKDTVLKGEYNKTNVAAAEVLISKAMKEGRIEEATQMLKELSVKATKSGQANQAWSMWSRLTPEGMLKYAVKEVLSAKDKMGAATKFVNKAFGRKAPELTSEDATIITDLMKKANTAVTEEEKAKFVKLAMQTISDKIPLGVSEIIDAYRYNNMLSGLPTHERNFFYNVWNSFITPALTLVAEGRPREAIKYELSAIKAIPKGLDNFFKVMARNIPIDLSKVEIKNVRFQKLPRPITVFSELMEASDKTFSTIIESAEMGIGKTAVEAKQISEEFLLRTPIGTKEKGVLNDSIDSMAKGIEAFGRMFKPVRWAVPFLRTPFNAAKMWLDYSPIGVANLIGNKNKRTVIAKALLGSGAAMVGAKMALEGRTTWSVPVDKKQKEWFYATKRKPFSILINDTWVPAQYFGPFAFALLLPAAANYYYNESPKALSDGDMGKLGKTLTSILGFWSQSSPMANLGGFVKTMEGDIDFSISKNIAFTVSQLKPYEGMLRYIANIFDPVYRKASTFGEQMISDIPFLKQNLEAYTEPTGEESVREPINFLLPWAIGKENQSYETYYQGRETELQQNALETLIRKNYEEGNPPPLNASAKMKADFVYSQLKKAVDKQDKKLVEKIKASGLYTPEVKVQITKYAKLEKLGIMKSDRDLLQFEGAARAAEALKRIQTLSPKNQAKHLKLLIDAKIVTPDVLAEMKKLYKKK